MKEKLKAAMTVVLLGILVIVGVRIAEWTIPAPEMRIVVCFANELDQVEICKPADELLKRKGGGL